MWYVIQVYTGRELEIARQCRERVMIEGEDVFVPLAERWTKIRGERTLITSRLFPGYVFIETDLRRLGGDGHVVKYSEGYMEGQKLVVTSGPLKDFEGKVKKILRHKRLVVMEVPLLGQAVEVTLGLGVVEKKEEVAESI